MKKILIAIAILTLVLALMACGSETPQDTAIDTAPDTSFELDIIGGNYKVVYDITDPNAIVIMTDMIEKIETESGVKLGSLNVSNTPIEYEIQLGLKTGRSEGESLYNEIKGYSDEYYGAYAIRAIGNRVIITGSDNDALKLAADRFASMSSTVFTVKSDLNETAIFNVNSYKRGDFKPVYFEEFGGNTEIVEFIVGGKKVGTVAGKTDYFRAKEGLTELPSLTVKTKYPTAKVEITEETNRYGIKIKSADGTKEEIYSMSFIDTAPLDCYSINTWTIPYWEGNITYHESLMFVGNDGAPLLYTPEHILSVRSYDLKTEYIEGVDYEVKDGKIYRLAEGAIPGFTLEEFYPASKETSITGEVWGGRNKPLVLCGGAPYFHTKQVFVTYTHKENSDLFVPQKSAKLAKFVSKLEKGENVNLVFFGDSITAGGDASGISNTAPFTPRWSDIVRDVLAAKYPSAKINFTNTAVAGKETNWAIEEVNGRVNAYKPDLLILAFGMNDGSKTPEEFVKNTKVIIDEVLAANPDCEIAVISTMLPHEETTYYKNQYLQEAALYDMAKSYKNVDIIPVMSAHSSILAHKRYYDMTSNNINHANDFLVRVYAQTILKTLIG